MAVSSHGVSGWTLFLDFDGVLNNDGFLRHQRNHVDPSEHRLFSPENVGALNRLCTDLPVASIVVTSTWRIGRSLESLRGLLGIEGFLHPGLVEAVTGVFDSRADAIDDFLANSRCERWFILDDMSLGARGAMPRATSLGLFAEGFVAKTCSTPGTAAFWLRALDENSGARSRDALHHGLLGERFGERFFQTSPASGFTEAICSRVLRALG